MQAVVVVEDQEIPDQHLQLLVVVVVVDLPRRLRVLQEME